MLTRYIKELISTSAQSLSWDWFNGIMLWYLISGQLWFWDFWTSRYWVWLDIRALEDGVPLYMSWLTNTKITDFSSAQFPVKIITLPIFDFPKYPCQQTRINRNARYKKVFVVAATAVASPSALVEDKNSKKTTSQISGHTISILRIGELCFLMVRYQYIQKLGYHCSSPVLRATYKVILLHPCNIQCQSMFINSRKSWIWDLLSRPDSGHTVIY